MPERKKIIITGGSGFIGTGLTGALLKKGYQVEILDFLPPKLTDVSFHKMDLARAIVKSEIFEGAFGIIHLAGKNIFCRWSDIVKKEIYNSRIVSARNLISSLGKVQHKPKVFISASAVGFYGDRGEEGMTEDSGPGDDFLANVCRDWEEAARASENLGLRWVSVRTAPVLGRGGFLKILLPFFRLGLGGTLGRGDQWFPWIHLTDLINIYLFALENNSLRGPVNACAPEQVTNKDFTEALAEALKKPTMFRISLFALRLRYGQLADAIFTSQKITPKKLTGAGFRFSFPELERALKDLVK